MDDKIKKIAEKGRSIKLIKPNLLWFIKL